MEKKLYNPFDEFSFDTKTCFLSGEKLIKAETYPVFPSWIIENYGLSGKPFKMLDESLRSYQDVNLPCSEGVKDLLQELDREVEQAFQQGYQGVKDLNATRLFQWVAKWTYGVIFNEIQAGMRQQILAGEPINFSHALIQKFSNLHKMMQSIIVPVEFETVSPFSIFLFKVDNPENFFNYRDEINTLVFSLRIKDLGIIVNLQDNGTGGKYHQSILEQVSGRLLHPIQFEELCARFFYSAYLFNRLPDYTILETPQGVFIEPMPMIGVNSRPVFDNWQSKTYAQVLENFWKPWGYLLFEILKDPENPVSFLQDAHKEFIPREAVSLPLAGI